MKWALVLSGGGAAGLAYIGFFKALEELQLPKPDCIVGCSMGAIVGGLYALGTPVQEMEALFKGPFDIYKYVGGVSTPIFKHTLSTVIQYGTLLTRMIKGLGADSGEKTYQFFLELSRGKSFSDCSIPFYCNAFDICSGKEVILESGLLADAMRASSSYPGLFAPVKHGEALLIDACFVHNTPVWIARKMGYTHILALTFGSFNPISIENVDSSLTVLVRTLDCVSAQIKLTGADYPSAALTFTRQRSASDFSNPNEQITFGYHKTMEERKTLQTFFAKGLLAPFHRFALKQKTKKETHYV